MRIAVLSDLWPPFPGGAEKYVYYLTKRFARKHEVRVLTSYQKNRDGTHAEIGSIEEYDGFQVERGDFICHVDTNLPERCEESRQGFARWLEAYAPDLIFKHMFFSRLFDPPIQASGLPTVQVTHGKDELTADLHVYNSEYTKRRQDPPQPDGMVIYPTAEQDVVAAKRVGGYLGFVKPVAHKGIDFLYELAAAMPHKQFLVMRGEWHLCDRIREGLPNVTYVGPYPCIAEFYGQCDLMLVPSLHEDAGTISQEATMNGLPCLSTDIMGLTETNGGIRLPLDVKAWKDTITRLFNDGAYWERTVEAQWIRFRELDWDGRAAELERRMEALCAR